MILVCDNNGIYEPNAYMKGLGKWGHCLLYSIFQKQCLYLNVSPYHPKQWQNRTQKKKNLSMHHVTKKMKSYKTASTMYYSMVKSERSFSELAQKTKDSSTQKILLKKKRMHAMSVKDARKLF